MNWRKVRKKPIEVKAFQFTLNNWNVVFDAGPGVDIEINGVTFYFDESTGFVNVNTLEGSHEVTENDWIIEGIKGEHYPCKPDIFKKTYTIME